MGAQWTRHVTPDVYCFVRKYCNSVCFVALNRSTTEVTVEVVESLLSDGEYRCEITKEYYKVVDCKLTNLVIKARGAIVLSHIEKAVKGAAIVRAQLNGLETQLGETVVVVGDCPELGNWDISKAFPLQYINRKTWFGEISINESAGKLINYKYALWRDGQAPVRENLVARRWVLPTQGEVKWRDVWSNGNLSHLTV